MHELNNPESYIQLGHFYLSPHESAVYLDYGDWKQTLFHDELLRLRDFIDHRKVTCNCNDNWTLRDTTVLFQLKTGQCTDSPQDHSIEVPINEIKQLLTQLSCPHQFHGDVPELKQCQYCVYFRNYLDNREYRCCFTRDAMKPIIRICNEGRDKYIKKWAFHQHDYGEAHAEMRFTVPKPLEWTPRKWDWLRFYLHASHDLKSKEDGREVYAKYWPISNHIKYTITLNPKDHSGVIEAWEDQEISCADDWYQIKFMDKTGDCLFAFAEVCQAIRGEVELLPVPPKETVKLEMKK